MPTGGKYFINKNAVFSENLLKIQDRSFIFTSCPMICYTTKAPPAEQKAEMSQRLRPNKAHTKSSGESACNPPTWMKLPSLANCTCRCSGIADLAILLGMWEPTRNSLFRSNSFTCRETASFLCRGNVMWSLCSTDNLSAHIHGSQVTVKLERLHISPVCHPDEFHWFQSRTWTTLPLVWKGRNPVISYGYKQGKRSTNKPYI